MIKKISIQVDNSVYKYICKQPYGIYSLFENKPCITFENEEKTVGYWYAQGKSEDIQTGIPEFSDWKESLKKI